ncbi:Uncharacterised protein [Mycobacteroides abscessus subsp. abscessus]|nr:Uncharacterised protein [Mycobacteroides abscessus subsp. abscessus]
MDFVETRQTPSAPCCTAVTVVSGMTWAPLDSASPR